jgi:hypothetical protein
MPRKVTKVSDTQFEVEEEKTETFDIHDLLLRRGQMIAQIASNQRMLDKLDALIADGNGVGVEGV